MSFTFGSRGVKITHEAVITPTETVINIRPESHLATICERLGTPRAPVRLKLLGHMAAWDSQHVLALPRVRKTRAVLALLALAAPKALSRETLTALLWSQRQREQARGSLRQALHELQSILQPLEPSLLIAGRNELTLRGEVWVDVHALAQATAERPEALELLDGLLLDDLAGVDPALDRWIQQERRRIITDVEMVVENMLRSGAEADEVIRIADRLLALDRTREGIWRALIEGHYRRGDLQSATRAYERLKTELADTNRGTPSEQTQTLFNAITGKPTRPPVEADRHEKRGTRLGVMPFRCLDPNQDQELSLGLAEEITTALSRFRWMFLISSTSLAVLAKEPGFDTPAWRELGIDFLLDGSVQRGGGRVRVIVRLLDMQASGEVVWAHRFDRPADDILTLQDEIAAETAAKVDPELLLHESKRAISRPANDPTAYDLVLRAIPAIYQLKKQDFRAAGEALAAAVIRDPSVAHAHSWWAYWHILLVGQGWAEDAATAMVRANELAERAIALDPFDARAFTVAGHVRAFLHRRIGEAIELHERALTLNPNLPLAWVFSGLAHSYAGDHAEGLRRIEHARRLSPFDPHAFFFDMALMIPNLMLGEYAKAVEISRRATLLNPDFTSTLKGHLSALGHLGWTEEQRQVREKLLSLEPGFCLRAARERSPLLRPEDVERYVEGLRLAGLPE